MNPSVGKKNREQRSDRELAEWLLEWLAFFQNPSHQPGSLTPPLWTLSKLRVSLKHGRPVTAYRIRTDTAHRYRRGATCARHNGARHAHLAQKPDGGKALDL